MGQDSCLILVGGEKPDSKQKVIFDFEGQDIICADSGAHHAYDWHIVPGIICGDFDSIKDNVKNHFEKLQVEFVAYPIEKDWTDTELAIQIAIERGYHSCVLAGLDGGRIDHQFTNYFVASRYARQIDIQIIGNHHRTYFLSERFPKICLDDKKGKVISVIPLEESTGIDYVGLHYSLPGRTLFFGTGLGMSNFAKTDHVEISLEQGLLMIVVNE